MNVTAKHLGSQSAYLPRRRSACGRGLWEPVAASSASVETCERACRRARVSYQHDVIYRCTIVFHQVMYIVLLYCRTHISMPYLVSAIHHQVLGHDTSFRACVDMLASEHLNSTRTTIIMYASAFVRKCEHANMFLYTHSALQICGTIIMHGHMVIV